HTVTLPQANGNLAPESAGASLVVIYRDPSPTAPLRKITIYEGAYVQAQNASLLQHIRGFYQASASPDAYLTQIVSAGAKNKTAALSFNNVPLSSSAFQAAGSQDDRTWFTRTDNVGALLRYDTTNPADKFGETATVTLSHGNSNPYECLAWSAMIFSTTVADTDGDGLPDGIEAATGGLKDPDGTLLPNLNAMGARVGQKDVFVEINAMKTDVPQTYGGVQAPPHNHMPSASVLNSVGDALLSAGVKVHFDVGPALGLTYALTAPPSEPYRFVVDSVTAPARGGESISEQTCVVGGKIARCQFPGWPGTVSWKIGFQLYRDAPVHGDGSEISAAELQACAASHTCGTQFTRRRFDGNREGLFHYLL